MTLWLAAIPGSIWRPPVERLLVVARSMGLSVRHEHGRKFTSAQWPWTGAELVVDLSSIDAARILAHEIAHWLLATPRRRKLPDFGLDNGKNYAEHDREENLASLLSILIEREVGADWMSTAIGVEWLSFYGQPIGDGRDVRHFWQTVSALTRHGLLVDGVPVCCLEPTERGEGR